MSPTAPKAELDPDAPPLVRALPWDQRVTYLPIRHHSPACAFHVAAVIREVRPDHVLVEGPRDATALIAHLLDSRTENPVAIYTTYIERRKNDAARHHGAYYPVCDYSPELAAFRTGAEVGAQLAFVDLTYPEMVVAEKVEPDDGVRSLQHERYLQRSQRLAQSCRRLNVRDADDLWDHLFEARYHGMESRSFFDGVLTYCAMGRSDYDESMIAAEAHDVREAAMKHAVDSVEGKVVIVTGGFHTVVLPDVVGREPRRVRLSNDADASTTLMRYNFEQLDALNGYASGMRSPEFYQRGWEGGSVVALVVELARQIRSNGGHSGTADVIAATTQVENLRRFRGHQSPTREDFIDAVRSVFVKGAMDVEGVAVLAQTQKFLTGTRTGAVPPEAGRPPIVQDFEREATRLGLRTESTAETGEKVLDLYRSTRHRDISRFFYRLRLIEVPYGTLSRGPDFVNAVETERLQEVWRYSWEPATESALIEKAKYGATLVEAAAAKLVEEFDDVIAAGVSSDAVRLIAEAYRCGLHEHGQRMLDRAKPIIAHDSSFASVATSCSLLTMLRFACEPLEAHNEDVVYTMAQQAWFRAAYLVPTLAGVQDSEATHLDALCGWRQDEDRIAADGDWRDARVTPLRQLLDDSQASPVFRGAACGLLFGDDELSVEELAQLVSGFIGGSDVTVGGRFVQGLMRASRSICFRAPGVLQEINQRLQEMSDGDFTSVLPHLRLAFSELTPRETDAVAQSVSDLLTEGEDAETAPSPAIAARSLEFTESDALLGSRVEAAVSQWLTRDDFGRLFDE